MISRRQIFLFTHLLPVCLFLAVAAASVSSHAQSGGLPIRLIFHVKTIDEFDELRSILTRFAEAEGFSVFDNGAILPPKPDEWRGVFFLILKQPDGVEVDVSNVREATEVLVFIYRREPSLRFDEIRSKVEHALLEKWPDLRPYEGP
jgi:hypothetical protein